VNEEDDDIDYSQSRVMKDQLYPGRFVFYRPDTDNISVGDEVPWGSIGIFLSMGPSWEKFVKGHEPIDVLFGAAGRVIRIYMDEIELDP
jgi:hypothetical protein